MRHVSYVFRGNQHHAMFPFTAIPGRNFQGPSRAKPRSRSPAQHGNPPPLGKTSFATAVTKKNLIPLLLIPTVRSWPDAWQQGSMMTLCSPGLQPARSLLCPSNYTVKKRRVSVGEVSPPFLVGAHPMFKEASPFPALPSSPFNTHWGIYMF